MCVCLAWRRIAAILFFDCSFSAVLIVLSGCYGAVILTMAETGYGFGQGMGVEEWQAI